MEYKIVSAYVVNMLDNNSVQDVAKKLEKLIHDAIKDGWKPIGGVTISHGESTRQMSMAQAMIKE